MWKLLSALASLSYLNVRSPLSNVMMPRFHEPIRSLKSYRFLRRGFSCQGFPTPGATVKGYATGSRTSTVHAMLC